MAIITKTQSQAKQLSRDLKSLGVHLLSVESTAFKSGVIITTTHLAKGLEFDEVVVPFISEDHYRNEVDRRMLYIACTRAMHRLTLTFTGKQTALIRRD